MKRRDFVKTATLGAASLLLPNLLSASRTLNPSRPNVIILLEDDQGYGDLSCHGNPVLKTPNLDKLHAESIRFTDFHSAPMCTPTRSQLMTGRDCLYNGATRVNNGRVCLRAELPTMADFFKSSGYRTGIFGKWHLGDNYPYRPIDRGFEEAVTFPGSHIASAPDFWLNDYYDDTYIHDGKLEQYSGYCEDIFFDQAMSWMHKCSTRNTPFFCYIPTNIPHTPYFVDDDYRNPYASQTGQVPAYFGMIAEADMNLGRLEAFLRDKGLRDNTIFIYSTDNGTAVGDTVFNAGMKGKKTDYWEGGHRVPCFVRWPLGGLVSPKDFTDLAEMQDILPTLIDLCGLQNPLSVGFDGSSLAPLLRGQTAQVSDRKLVVQYCKEPLAPAKWSCSIMWGKWRLLNQFELYNIDSDPGQATDVYNLYPAIASALQTHYEQWWANVSPRIAEFMPITIGSQQENPTKLCVPDWYGDPIDMNTGIRQGLKKNGVYKITVAQAGNYRIALRRWPIEADTAITAAVPIYNYHDSKGFYGGVYGNYPAGVALAITSARLQVSTIDQTVPVQPTDKEVVFNVTLPQGPTTLQTWFNIPGSTSLGAFYVYVTRL